MVTFNMLDAKCSPPPDTRAQSSNSNGALRSPLCVVQSTMHATVRFATGTPADNDDDNDDELPLLILDMPDLVLFAESNLQLDKSWSKGQVT